MYCPKCGTDNLETASFCRKCGVDLRLVPQALSGQLSQERTPVPEIERRAPANLEHGIKKFMMGLVFLIIALTPIFSGNTIWWWFLFPAAPLLAAGIAEFARLKYSQRVALSSRPAQSRAAPVQHAVQSATSEAAFPTRETGELLQPPSVTEGTTRLLGTEAQTRPIASPVENQRREG